MKLLFKIEKNGAEDCLSTMKNCAANGEQYASFSGATWTTTGGSRYTVDLENGEIHFSGSRTSLKNGAGFGGVYRVDGGYILYLSGGETNFPLQLVSMKTSWENVHGWDDPLCTEAELIWAQQQDQAAEEFDIYCQQMADELSF